jgi:hypothetical protein
MLLPPGANADAIVSIVHRRWPGGLSMGMTPFGIGPDTALMRGVTPFLRDKLRPNTALMRPLPRKCRELP